MRHVIGEMEGPSKDGRGIDVAIVGAGFAGMYMLYRARKLGLTARVFEAGGGVGGTWYWNRYPGARCDVESMEYSYQFSEELQQEWNWSERYSPQPEILRYTNHVADRFDLRSDIQFNARVETATFDDTAGKWRITIAGGETVEATYCVMATGCLSAANTPEIKGINSFRRETYHTGRWPHEGVSFAGKRVGIIGTGSSAIQSVPCIAEEADQLYVFQRTPNYSVPARNAPLDPAIRNRVKARYPALRAEAKKRRSGILFPETNLCALAVAPAERRRRFDEYWETGGLAFLSAFVDLLVDKAANDTAADFIREKIAAIVKNPQTAEALAPDSVVGCKRLCADSGYFEAFNRPNVTLVDIRDGGIEEITPAGVVAKGKSFDLDMLVFATGFDAMTGALNRIRITGADGRLLREKWASGPRTYLGVATAGFPNLFVITGPGSPSVLANMIPAIEQHVDWIGACIDHARRKKMSRIEAEPKAEDDWVAHVNQVAGATLYPGCNSWYLGANVPGKPRVFMPYLGFDTYVAKCEQVVAAGYEGFRFAPAANG